MMARALHHLYMVCLAMLMLICQPGMGLTQSLPEPVHTTVNDFANLLTQDSIRNLDQSLIALHDQTGVQGTVVTLPDRAGYGGHDGLEAFATRLFNHWGVGLQGRNDGFMVLIIRDDREARIELGSGYPPAADTIARRIMDDAMLPAFRNGHMSQGIETGTIAIIDRIAMPHARGLGLTEPSPKNGNDILLDGIAILILITIAAFIWWRFRRKKRCPECGHHPLLTETAPQNTALDDGGWETSYDKITRKCPNCGWQTDKNRQRPQIITYSPDGTFVSRRENSTFVDQTFPHSGGGFGGGSSSGGGASGRW